MKVLIIGSGSIGKRHIKNIFRYSQEKKEYLIIDLFRSSKSELPVEILNIINKQIFNQSDISEKYDAIFITNPTNLHYPTLLKMLPYSDNFFIEKPVFDKINVDLSALCDTKKNYYVACPLRYTEILLAAKKFVETNNIFSVRAISSSFLPDWRPGIDYRTTYSAKKEMGGGVLIDLIHEWDYLSSFLGFPQKVEKYYGKYSNLEINSEDLAVYIAQYKDKLLELHLDYCGKQTRRSCEFITDEGVFCFDIANNQILKNGIVQKAFNDNRNDMYYNELKTFFAITKNMVDNPNTIENAIKVMKVALEGTK